MVLNTELTRFCSVFLLLFYLVTFFNFGDFVVLLGLLRIRELRGNHGSDRIGAQRIVYCSDWVGSKFCIQNSLFWVEMSGVFEPKSDRPKQ